MLEVFQFYLTTSKSITTKDALDSALYPFFFFFFFLQRHYLGLLLVWSPSSSALSSARGGTACAPTAAP